MAVSARLRALLACALLGASAQGAYAQEPSPSPSPSPVPVDEGPKLKLSAFVDTVFAYNFNRPFDHANFFPGVGTSAKRHDEISINQAEVDVVLPPEPVGFKLALNFGTSTEVVHAAEVRGVAVSPDVWRNLVQASVQWQTSVGRGLLLEAGVYPSHIGLESFQTKDNWNYTRSWLGELSPYYQAGLKAALPLSDHWSAQLHLLNGWQTIADNNDGKSLGAQLAWSGDRASFTLNGFVGPELPGDDDDLRTMVDVLASFKATPSLTFSAAFDAAHEERPVGDAVGWHGIGLYARFAPPSSRTAFAVRAEYYDDEDGAISGVAQTLKEVTATLEHRPLPRLILKLEGRYDRSSAEVFTAEEPVAPAGSDPGLEPFRKRTQFLLLLGAVATF
jgi:hypothetical protein